MSGPGEKFRLPNGSSDNAGVSEPRYVTLQKGDSLSKIAQNAHISLNEVLNLNPGIAHPDMIYPGQIIKLK